MCCSDIVLFNTAHLDFPKFLKVKLHRQLCYRAKGIEKDKNEKSKLRTTKNDLSTSTVFNDIEP